MYNRLWRYRGNNQTPSLPVNSQQPVWGEYNTIVTGY